MTGSARHCDGATGAVVASGDALLPNPDGIGHIFVSAGSADTRHFELDSRRADVLAVGSQLAYGSVGLNAAVPVYEAAGLRCAAVPTTILSVLPHYPSVHRTNMPAEWVSDALADLDRNGALDDVRAIGVGYLATPAHAMVVAEWHRSRSGSTKVPLVLDPTLGDVGFGFYNDPDVAAALRRWLIPEATGLTPNLFELAHLAECPLASLSRLEDVAAAARALMTPQTQWIVVTGLGGSFLYGDDGRSDRIGELVVTPGAEHVLDHLAVPGTLAGVGDNFAAVLISRLVVGDGILPAADLAAEQTAATIRARGKRAMAQ